MASPNFDIRVGGYAREVQRLEQHRQAKAQREALQNMKNFHYRDRGLMNAYTPPKPRTNAIGIPLIKQSSRYYG